MPLTKTVFQNYSIKTSSKSQLTEQLTNSIAQSISFNLNVIFQIKITKNWSFDKG